MEYTINKMNSSTYFDSGDASSLQNRKVLPEDSLKTTIPWIEKYRPTQFCDIVLDPINRLFFNNILKKNYFPNLIFYGTPGTGKTTTIINLIHEYQKKYFLSARGDSYFTEQNDSFSSTLCSNEKIKSECRKMARGSIIHLNASDERGIDVIRSQINQFVKSKNIFDSSCKFVILDEVDHMTKNAQQALKYLIQTSNYNVHYCLICNYISKIDESLQQEFICVRFNQLPKKDVFQFIKNISDKENIHLEKEEIETIQEIYNSDVRSIINFIQLNQNLASPLTEEHLPSQATEKPFKSTTTKWCKNIITYKTWEDLHLLLKGSQNTFIGYGEAIQHCVKEKIDFIQNISSQYNMDKKDIIKTYFNYIIKNKVVTRKLLDIIETIIHSEEIPNDIMVEYFVVFVSKYLREM
jgi:replication factor C subunit 3/5